jgi:hypothetical protein
LLAAEPKIIKKMNSRRIICAGTLLAGAMLFGGIAQGAISTLDITENSSTSLTATLNGTPLSVAFGSDNWTITIPTQPIAPTGDSTWAEPESPPFPNETENEVVVLDATHFAVFSDDTGGTPFNFNKATDTSHFTYNGTELDVTFTDNSDIVPEPSTLFAGALLLMPFGISALRGLRRNLAQ